MTDKKFSVPTEIVDLPSKGKLYSKENPLSSGTIEMKYMTAREEDILTNINLLRQGLAIEKTLRALIPADVNYDSMILGDRNGLLIAARILAYGKDYSFKYKNPNTDEDEVVKVDLQNLKYKEIDFNKLNEKNEFTFELPYTKNIVTYKILTVEDDKKVDQEIKNLKKTLNTQAGTVSTRLKHQIISINGDSSVKSIRDFVDGGYLLSRDSIALRQDMYKNTPDIELKTTAKLKDGTEIDIDIPITSDFFFPGNE
jgi:hypothetical protein